MSSIRTTITLPEDLHVLCVERAYSLGLNLSSFLQQIAREKLAMQGLHVPVSHPAGGVPAHPSSFAENPPPYKVSSLPQASRPKRSAKSTSSAAAGIIAGKKEKVRKSQSTPANEG